MNAWVLVIAMSAPAPNGAHIGTYEREFKTRKECQAERARLQALDNPYGIKHNGVCVTMAHRTGKKVDKGVALD